MSDMHRGDDSTYLFLTEGFAQGSQDHRFFIEVVKSDQFFYVAPLLRNEQE
jgi:hypothetical protein